MCKMASSKKKRVEEVMDEELEGSDNEDDDLDDDDSDSEDDTPMDEHVQLDLEARMPEDSDFHGIKGLLQQVFLKANINVSEMTDTIISQNYIGSVMKQPYMEEMDDDDDSDSTVLALTTVINIAERKNLDCIQQMTGMLMDKCQKCAGDQSEKFGKLLRDPDHQVGFLVSERYLNLPPTVAVPMFESLLKEMEKARKKNMKYKFDYYLMICKTFEMKSASNKKQLFYSNSEEEFFQEVSALSFSYSVAHERDAGVQKWSSDEEMEPFRTVLVVPADQLPSLLEKITNDMANT